MRRASGMLFSSQTTGTLKASKLRAALQTYPPNTLKSPYGAVQAASFCQDPSRSTAAEQQQQHYQEWPAGAGPAVQARGRRRRAQLVYDDDHLNSIKAARASLDAAWHQEACINHHHHEAWQAQQSTDAASSDSLVGERSRRRSRRSRQASRGYDRSNHGDAGCSKGSSSRVGSNLQRWTRLHDQLLHTLRQQEQLLPRHASVLVAVSGGQDSMAMLRMLHDLSQKHWPLRLVVGHCDHRVRPDSAENAEHVRTAASGVLGLPYMQVQADRQQGHWPEAAARAWRHQQLTRMAAKAGCGYIALGHTATERAETVLFNMIRGAGTTGLGAMSWSRDLPGGVKLVRPLLGFTREHTLHVCEATGTQIYPDTTNTDQRYMRNRLRLSVFPLLQSINQAAVMHICNTAHIVKQESDLMHRLAHEQLAAALVPSHVVQAPLPQQQRGATTAEGALLVGGLQATASCPVRHQGTPSAAQSTAAAAAAKAGGNGSSSAGAAVSATAGHGGRASAEVAEGQTGGAAGAAFCGSYSAGLATVPWQLQQHSPAAAHMGPDMNQVFGQQADTSLQQQQQTLDSRQHSIQPPPSQQQQQQHPGQQGSSLYLNGLRVSVLAQQHPALQRRVVQLWLSQQTSRSVSFTHVEEVLQLLRSGVGTGTRTSTLWGSSCVLRYKQLLLLLDAATVQQVLSRQLQVGCVSVDAAGLQGLAAWIHTQQRAGKHSVARAVITEGQ